MKLSIITPMYNSEQYIGRMIQSLMNLDYPRDQIEIIIIDNGSDDDSVLIVQKMGIKCTVMKGASISQMRNAGASMASGKVLGFVDSDCLVDRDWAQKAISYISDDVGIVGGYYGLGDSPGWIEKTWHSLKKDIVGEVSFVSAGNMVIKAKLFSKMGGFDESIETGEDWDFCQRVIRAGYRVVNNPLLNVKHLGNFKSLIGIIKKERWYGRGMFGVLKGRKATKPLVVSILFLILIVTAIFGLFVASYIVTISALAAVLLLVIFTSYHFTRNIKDGRLNVFIRCIPISFCYIFGRSLAILDLMKKELIPAKSDDSH